MLATSRKNAKIILESFPIIDSHIHAQTLGWNDIETLAMINYKGMVIIATNYHWAAHIPTPEDEVRFLWHYAIRWAKYVERAHGIKARVAIAVHTLAKVINVERLLEYMPTFIRQNREIIAAIGETGFEPTQYGGVLLPYDEQEKILKRQFEIAMEFDLPIIVHTPIKKIPSQGAWNEALVAQREKWPEAKIESTRKAIELLKDVGVDEKKVVIDHADSSIYHIILGNTKNMICGFSTAIFWRGVGAEVIAESLKEYGSERIIVNSDLVGNAYYDLFAVQRIARNLQRMGFDRQTILNIVYKNPAKLFGFQEEYY